MRILIAEDDRVSRRLLEITLANWGHEILLAVDGLDAWRALRATDAPSLAILDWMMPGLDGVEVCRRVRNASESQLPYIILLTSRGRSEDIAEGLGAGADDYITKPFNLQELQARILVGLRIVRLHKEGQLQMTELEEALARIKKLQGLLPICASCKSIRDDKGYWNQIEIYIQEHSGADFSHGICPTCAGRLYPDDLDQMYPGREAEDVPDAVEAAGDTHSDTHGQRPGNQGHPDREDVRRPAVHVSRTPAAVPEGDTPGERLR
jgi:CheY-like chemotaxis protein